MAAFDVHAVEPGLLRKASHVGEALLVGLQLIVRKDAGGIDGRILERGIVVGDQRRGHAGGLGIAAGIRRLHQNHGHISVFLQAGFAHFVQQAGEVVHVLVGDHQLMRAGSHLRRGRDGFKPDQTRAAMGEAQVAAARERAGAAVRRAVGALHRLKRDAVRAGYGADRERRKQDGKIVAVRQKSAEGRDDAVDVFP